MEKHLFEETTSQNTYEIKGSINLLRNEMKKYTKQITNLLVAILVMLVIVAINLS